MRFGENSNQKDYNYYSNLNKEENRKKDNIEPWFDQPGTIPYWLLTTNPQKFQKKKNMRRFSSLQMPSIPVRSSQRLFQQRQSKQLPKKDIELQKTKNIITSPNKDQNNNNQEKTLKKKRKMSQPCLPTVTVTRQLMIQRKLFLMMNRTKYPQKHTCKSSKVRKVIKEQLQKLKTKSKIQLKLDNSKIHNNNKNIQ